MGEFDEDIKRIKQREARAERIEAYLSRFKESWLCKMIKEINEVLSRSGKKIEAQVSVSLESQNPGDANFKQYNRVNLNDPKVHNVISDVEQVFDTCMALLHIDWSGDGLREMPPIEKKQYRDIVAIYKKYQRKYVESDYEDEIRRLIAEMGGIVQLEMFDGIKASIPFVRETETKRVGAITLLNRGAKIKIIVRHGKISEIDISDADGDKHQHIDWYSDIEMIGIAISGSAVKSRFFDDDSSECSELTFSGGMVYETLKAIILDRFQKCNSFEGFRGEGSADTKIITAVRPLYKYLKTIAIDSIPADKMLIDLLDLNIERQKISNRIDKR